MSSLVRSTRFALHAAACSSALLLTAASGHNSLRCSMSALPDGPPSIFIVGTAMADTRMVAATVTGPDGKLLTGQTKAHVFDVARFAGLDAAKAGGAPRRIAVVPWGHQADCRTILWDGPGDWVEPGATGLVYGKLRAREQWVAGLPTIDVQNSYQLPFPARSGARFERLITADEAFTLLSVLPTLEELHTLDMAAVAPLIALLDGAPEYGGGEAKRRLTVLLRDITDRRVRNVVAPMAGTYRMTLELSDGRERQFFARTEARPVSTKTEAGDAWVAARRPPDVQGYTLLVAVSRALEELPASRQDGRYGYIEVAVAPDNEAGPATWQAGAELSLLRHAFPTDAAVQSFAAQDRNRAALSDFIARNLPPGAEGGFRRDAQGRVTFHQRYHLPSETSVVLRGERISLETMPPPPR
jgi:hypothetical protein